MNVQSRFGKIREGKVGNMSGNMTGLFLDIIRSFKVDVKFQYKNPEY